MFVTAIPLHSIPKCAGKAGAYQNEAPCGTPLYWYASSLTHKYQTKGGSEYPHLLLFKDIW
jgi:hypothetical protein